MAKDDTIATEGVVRIVVAAPTPDTLLCESGHRLYVSVEVSESVTYWNQVEDAALILEKDKRISRSPIRDVFVGCDGGNETCKISASDKSLMLYRFKNSERTYA